MFILITRLLLLSVCSLTFAQFTQHVDGNVYLEDSLDHEGITVSFSSLLSNPPELIGETTSTDDGSYDIDIEPGLYLIEWTKNGYVPWEFAMVIL